MTDPSDFPEVQKTHPLALDTAVLAGSIVAANPLRGELRIVSGREETLVTIDMDTGRVEFGPNYDPDEAARQFWAAIEQQHTRTALSGTSPDNGGPDGDVRRPGTAPEHVVQGLGHGA